MPLTAGTTLGPYEILSPLGAGGMGEVYKARDTRLDRTVAIKVLPEHVAADPDLKQRFEREAKTISSLNHPHICTLHDIGEQDGVDFLVMEYLEGDTLAQRLEQGALPLDQALKVGIEIADALDKAHRQGIVHRDIKPSNVMLTESGAKLLDFGLAKMKPAGTVESQATTWDALTEAGRIVGTPAYMAPEQIRGEPAETRSDIFSFGVVLFELLTGEHPFKRGTVGDTTAAILRDAPARAAGSGDQVDYAIFDKLLAKTPDDRYQSFDEVLVEVRRLRDSTSAWTEPSSGPADTTESRVGARRTPFVGREDERAELGRWLERAVRGRGGLVLIGGEPGVGKTRLVEEVLEAARQRRCLALTGRCYDIEGTAPFIPFVEIIEQYARVVSPAVLRDALGDAAPEVARLVPDLRRLFPDIPPPLELPPEQQRRYLFKNVAEFLERVSRARSTVLLFDDLQWADSATLLLLQHVAPLLGRLPVLALGTYRDVELDVNRPFAATLETLHRKRLAQRLNLQRLPQEGVASMLAALGGPLPPESLVAGIYRETEGNPFFVEEVFQHLEEEGVLHEEDGRWRSAVDLEELDVPEGVRLVIGRRLERVSADCRKVLTLGAIVGRGFSLSLLEAGGDVTGDALLTALEEAEADYLITPMRGWEPRWEFSHALIRQTLTGGVSLPRRQRLHLRVADAVERAGSRVAARPADLAHHLYQAGMAADSDRTISALQKAGEQALETGGFKEALGDFDRALSLRPAGGDVRAALLFRRGSACRGLGQWDQAVADWSKALPLFEAGNNAALTAATCLELAFGFTWLARLPESASSGERGLAALGREPSPARCRLLVQQAWSLSSLVQLRAASSAFSEALEDAEALGDDRLEGAVRVTGYYVHHHNLMSVEGLRSAERAVECLREERDPVLVAEARMYRDYMSVRTGHLAGLVEIEEELEELFESQGRLDLQIMASFMPRAWLLSGRPQDYDRFARRFLEPAKKMGAWTHIGLAGLSQARLWAGDADGAYREASEAMALEPHSRMETGHGWSARFLAAALLARRTEAMELLQNRRDELPRAGTLNAIGSWCALAKVIEGLAELGERQRTAELYPHALALRATGTRILRDAVHLVETLAGIAAAAGARWEEAEAHFEAALQQAEEVPFRSEQPEVRRWYAQMLIDRNAPGDRDKGRTLLGEATEMYHTIGMPKHLEMVERMSAAL